MTRVILRFALLLVTLLSTGALAIGQSPSKLASKEKAERIKALPDEERKWLTDYVAPIILPEEENLFLQLTEPHQRETFKAEFWKRREKEGLPPPLGPGYERLYAHLREVAATEYDGINRDAGRMVLLYGEPSSIQDLTECDVFRQAQFWT
jgi:GWxTD domain-containing protein